MIVPMKTAMATAMPAISPTDNVDLSRSSLGESSPGVALLDMGDVDSGKAGVVAAAETGIGPGRLHGID